MAALLYLSEVSTVVGRLLLYLSEVSTVVGRLLLYLSGVSTVVGRLLLYLSGVSTVVGRLLLYLSEVSTIIGCAVQKKGGHSRNSECPLSVSFKTATFLGCRINYSIISPLANGEPDFPLPP